MPFDVLPHHNIRIPDVQFYHPSPALAQMALEAQRYRYAMMMKGLDSVLSAVDPLNIAERRQKMAEAEYMMKYGIPYQQAKTQFEIEQLPLQRKMLEWQLNWIKTHPDSPFMPKSYADLVAAQKFGVQQGRIDNWNNAFTPGGGATTGTTPVITSPAELKSEASINQHKKLWDDYSAKVDKAFDSQDLTLAPPEQLPPPTQEQTQQYGPLPGFEEEDTGTVPSSSGLGP